MTLLESLDQQIKAKEDEIALKQSRIDILKDGIKLDNDILKLLKKSRAKFQEKYADQVDQETVGEDTQKV